MSESVCGVAKRVQAPAAVYYIPEFITPQEETYLLNQVYGVPQTKWTQLSNRRLQNWGGLPHPKGMVLEDLPQWLKTYADQIAKLEVFEGKVPNHVLVNEYEAGQGIMPHVDGPLYFPVVSTISLGSHTLLDFYAPMPIEDAVHVSQAASTSFEDRFMCSILLQPRSLVLVCEDMYKVYLHGIVERKADTVTHDVANLEKCQGLTMGDCLDRARRVSLTIRHVPKTVKAKLLFGTKR
ncbi:alpha-ketoglutarate-dependent dioxygenase alkB homolog 6-like isoform X2 [Dreissena polymorpha]|uniref:alpha-ketoglutarate-dependent dioxygenase alkB homolog 6-like isoform X2 n=1 Tax=Dreissena polymorpha TaxID=45954 RepID=UPI002263BE81|nr:alpha-ketoglutarate-dependent dioxygenase alkB homolog 6-like isoform X2 [Dreissena polymorpha]